LFCRCGLEGGESCGLRRLFRTTVGSWWLLGRNTGVVPLHFVQGQNDRVRRGAARVLGLSWENGVGGWGRSEGIGVLRLRAAPFAQDDRVRRGAARVLGLSWENGVGGWGGSEGIGVLRLRAAPFAQDDTLQRRLGLRDGFGGGEFGDGG
jgi:hypothetical protein